MYRFSFFTLTSPGFLLAIQIFNLFSSLVTKTVMNNLVRVVYLTFYLAMFLLYRNHPEFKLVKC